MKRKVEVSKLSGTREPRVGELNYDLRRILLKHCAQSELPLSNVLKSIELALARLAKKHGFKEYECKYSRDGAVLKETSKRWICDSIQIIIFRKRNGHLSIYRAGAGTHPHFFKRGDKGYANLSAPRDMNIYFGVDEEYTWETYNGRGKKNAPKRLKARWKRLNDAWKRKKHAHS